MTTTQDIFGEPIYAYTVDQAIEDGVLVHFDPKNYPYLLLTAGVFAKCEETGASDGREIRQVVIPLMQDVIVEIRRRMKRNPELDMVKLEHTAAGTVWAMPNEKGGVTIMNPEDY